MNKALTELLALIVAAQRSDPKNKQRSTAIRRETERVWKENPELRDLRRSIEDAVNNALAQDTDTAKAGSDNGFVRGMDAPEPATDDTAKPAKRKTTSRKKKAAAKPAEVPAE